MRVDSRRDRRHVYLALCELSDTTPEPDDEDESELAAA
jgi:hypothetical protein